jgi:hypothetical protein
MISSPRSDEGGAAAVKKLSKVPANQDELHRTGEILYPLQSASILQVASFHPQLLWYGCFSWVLHSYHTLTGFSLITYIVNDASSL